jgi:hypothetical protein
VSDECLYGSECDLINCVRRYIREFKEYEEERDDEGKGILTSAQALTETIYRCRKMMYRGETSPMVNNTYFIIHSQDTIYSLMYWNKKYLHDIRKVDELIERISNITDDKYEKEDYSSHSHIEYRIDENENEDGNEKIIKDKIEL